MKPGSNYKLTRAQRKAKFTPKKYRVSSQIVDVEATKKYYEDNLKLAGIHNPVSYKISTGVSKPLHPQVVKDLGLESKSPVPPIPVEQTDVIDYERLYRNEQIKVATLEPRVKALETANEKLNSFSAGVLKEKDKLEEELSLLRWIWQRIREEE